MDGRHGNLATRELALHAVRAVTRACEHDHAVPLGMVLEEVDEEVVLVALLHEHARLRNLVHGRRLGRHHHLDRVVHELAGEVEDFGRKRGAEEHRLAKLAGRPSGRRAGGRAVRREFRDDALDVRQEAHVEHPVRLVEHEQLHAVEVHHALRHQVDEASRGGDHHLGALLERLHLRELRDAPEHDRERRARVLRVGGIVLGRLRREFARGRENQRTRVPGLLFPLVSRLLSLDMTLQQLVKNGQHERGGLARARLGAADQVASFEERRDGLLLDGRGDGVPRVGDGVLEACVELAEHVRLVGGGRRVLGQLGDLRRIVLLGETEMRLRLSVPVPVFEKPRPVPLEPAITRILELPLHLIHLSICFSITSLCLPLFDRPCRTCRTCKSSVCFACSTCSTWINPSSDKVL